MNSRFRIGMVLATVIALAGIAWAAPAVTIDVTRRWLKAGFFSGTAAPASEANLVTSMLSTTATLDFANKTITCEDLDSVVLNGAKPGDPCLVSPGAYTAQAGNGSYSCFVKDDGGIAVRHCAAGTATNPDAGTFRIRVISSQ